MIPVFSIVSAAIVERTKVKHAYALLFGSTFQLIGAGLFLLIGDSTSIDPASPQKLSRIGSVISATKPRCSFLNTDDGCVGVTQESL